MGVPIDYGRIRSGDTKYFVRDVFRKIYGDMQMVPKIPMPRPMNEWMANWGDLCVRNLFHIVLII